MSKFLITVLMVFVLSPVIYSQDFLQVKYSINDIQKQRENFLKEKVKSVTVKYDYSESMYEIDKEDKMTRIPGAFTNTNIERNISIIQDSILSDTNFIGLDLNKLDSLGGAYDTLSCKVNSSGLNMMFSENKVGLNFRYPSSWVVITSNQINSNIEQQFEGVVIADTSIEVGGLNIFIVLGNSNNEFNTEKLFNERFIVDHDSIIAYQSQPIHKENRTTFEYYLFFPDAQKLYVKVFIHSEYYEHMLETIENSIRTINIQKPHSTITTYE